MSENDLVQTLIEAQKSFQTTVCQMMQTWNQENKDAQKRIHERLDQLLNKESISRESCEGYRAACKAATCEKISKAERLAASNVPKWVAIMGSVAFSLIVGMAMFIITNAHKLSGQ